MGEIETAPNLIQCNDCGRQVPDANMAMHQIRACRARARRPGQDEEESLSAAEELESMEVDSVDSDDQPVVVGATTPPPIHRLQVEEVDDSSSGEDSEVQVLPSAAVARTREETVLTPQRGIRRRRRRTEEPEGHAVEVVDLVNVDDNPARTPNGDQWACPLCTLLNSKNDSLCNACLNPNPERPPDHTRSERLVDGSPSAHFSFVSGGALMGGILGAAGSFINGRDPFTSAFEGAMTGVVGGAFLNGALSSRQNANLGDTFEYQATQQHQPMDVALARSSASSSGGYPSMSSATTEGSRRARPRSSFRVERTQNNDGTRTTVIMGGMGTTTIRRQSHRSPIGMNDQLRSYLLHAMAEEQRHGGQGIPNIDGMGYEELLQEFGDGSENLGASEAQIESLPSRTINDPEKELPEEARQCLICLEDIVKGETRKILPCLHGFHSSCCNRWLQTNGSCPICKHRIA